MPTPLRSPTGSPLKLNSRPQVVECSDCCDQQPPGECRWWLELTSCDCAMVVLACAPDNYFTCQPPEGGPPAIGTVVRQFNEEWTQPPYLGGCWQITDVFEQDPDPHPHRIPHVGIGNFEPACMDNGCDDVRCVDYGNTCPPCPWDICDGWQSTHPFDCGFITRHAYIRRMVSLAYFQLSLQWTYRAINRGFYAQPIGTLMQGHDLLATCEARQYSIWDWNFNTGQIEFKSRTLFLDARFQFSAFGVLTGDGCEFDRSISVAGTVQDEFEQFNGPCGPIYPIQTTPIRCRDDPTMLAQFAWGPDELFAQCPGYAACSNPAIWPLIGDTNVRNNLAQGQCQQSLTVVDQHTNTIDGQGCGEIIDRVHTEDRYFRPWNFTRTTVRRDHAVQRFSACGTGSPGVEENYSGSFLGAISGRAWWYLCNQDLPEYEGGNVGGSGGVAPPPTPSGGSRLVDPNIETFLNQDPMRRCRGCGQ